MIYKGVTVTFGASYLTNVEVVDIGLNKMAAGTQETTHQASTATSGQIFRTYVATGLVDPGEISLKVNYTPASSSELGTSIIGQTGNLVVTFPTTPACKVTCTNAICTGFEPENGTLGNFSQATIKFKISALPVFAAAS